MPRRRGRGLEETGFKVEQPPYTSPAPGGRSAVVLLARCGWQPMSDPGKLAGLQLLFSTTRRFEHRDRICPSR